MYHTKRCLSMIHPEILICPTTSPQQLEPGLSLAKLTKILPIMPKSTKIIFVRNIDTLLPAEVPPTP